MTHLLAIVYVTLVAGFQADNQAGVASRTLQLTVLDDNDAPVPNATVKMRIVESGGKSNVTGFQCDDRGQLQIDVPEPAPPFLSIRIDKLGHAPLFAEWSQQGTPDPIPDSFTARLDPGRLIGGIVRNEEGQPVAGAKVGPHFNLKMREERTYPLGSGVHLTTDERGQWTYPSFPADVGQLQISIVHPDYAATRITQPTAKFTLTPDAAPSEVLVIKRGLKVRGEVTDENGKPIGGARVIYHELTLGDKPQATTNEEGVYQFVNGQAGEKFFTASADGWAPAIQEVRVAPDLGRVDFKLSRGNSLRVRVVDSNGAPIAGVQLTLWTWQGNQIYGTLPDSRGKTNAQGEWEWAHAPDGTIGFAISKSGYSYIREQELTPGETENLVTMKPESVEETRVLKILGRVIDAETKEPIDRFRVTPGEQRQGSNTIYWHQQNQSESRDGRYRREITPNMTTTTQHVLRVEAEGYVPATSRVIRNDEQEVSVDFALKKGKGADFLVLTPEGDAAKEATVAICTTELGPMVEDGIISPNSTCERTTTSGEGRFNIQPPNGVFALMIVHETGAAYVTQLALHTSKTIELLPWSRVEGTLRIQGKPAANEPVTLHRTESYERDAPKIHYSYRTTTDNQGKFAFERVVPGAGQLQRNVVTNLDGGMSTWTPTHVMNTEFLAGEATHVDLSREGRQVVGKFAVSKELEKENDWRLAMVTLQPTDPPPPAAPPIPFPADIDPANDRDAAMKWWDKWKDTAEGKAFQELMKLHQTVVQAMSAMRPPSYGAKVEPDGSFSFDDVPAGAYQLSVSAQSRPAGGGIGPGRIIASLTHSFRVEPADQGAAGVLDLGDLQLQPTNQ